MNNETEHILIVDDVLELSEYLSIVLKKWNYHPVTACNGQEALEKFALYRPRFSIVDIGMPVMDGYEVARRLRALYPHDEFALIALSGYGARHDKVKAHESGFDLHLTKPANLPELRQIIDGYFNDPTQLDSRTKEQWAILSAAASAIKVPESRIL